MMEEIYDSSPIELLLEKWRRRKWLLVGCFLLVFSVVAGYVLAMPSLYKSSTTVLFGLGSISEEMVRTGVTSELEQRLGIVTQAVLSRDRLQAVIDDFRLYPDLRTTMPAESVINRMRKDINISQHAYAQSQGGQNTTYAITITYQAWDPDLAAQVANELAVQFKYESESIRTGQAARTTAFIREQLEVARNKFVAEETRINEYRNQHMGELPEQQAINLATLDRLNSELRLKGEKQVQLLSRRDDLMFGMGDGNRPLSTSAGLTGNLRLSRLNRELVLLQQSYTDNYPGVIRMQKEIAQLELEIAAAPAEVPNTEVQTVRLDPAEIEAELAQLVAEENALRSEILALATRISESPLIGQQLRSFSYDYDNASNTYVSLQKRYQDSLLAESLQLQQSEQFKVLEIAIPPDFPAAPGKLGLLFMGVILATGVAGGSGLIAEHLDRSFHTVTGLRRFTRVPVLASIGAINTTSGQWRKSASILLGTFLVLGAIFLLTLFAHQLGQNAELVVWQLSE